MCNNSLFEKAVKASARFLERRGYEVAEQNWSPEGSDESVPLIAYDDDTLVFIDVKVRNGAEGFAPEAETDREAMEVLAAKYLAETDVDPDFRVRFDIISMMVIAESRALLRHHINAFSEAA
ncbi:YraN family protein [Slackia exigua]|uniref:YraN family protein n=1 Tax=Slackia exigua TaxID=84109 RepID=UPI002109F63D|nr:YraN family protein [Slackia exigua]MCQ5090959.1 YraN family protein [Slackia exigua]